MKILRRNPAAAWMVMLAISGTGNVCLGANEWTSLGPAGGEIQALSIDPRHPGTIYAATGTGHAFNSVNGGASWMESRGPNGVLIFDPQDANTLYAVSGYPDGILKSTDNGASWRPANSGLPTSGPPYYFVSALVIDPQDPLVLYAGTSSGIFKSKDGGTSWSATNSGLPRFVSSGDTLPIDQNRYVAAYALLIDPKKAETVYAVVDHSNAPGALLFKSTDGGGSWNPAGSGLPESGLILAIDPQNPSTLYAGTSYGIYKSTDGGAGWSPVNSGLPPFPTGPPPFLAGSPYFNVDTVVIDPRQTGTVYATIESSFGGLVVKTTNGGASWSDVGSGLPGGTYVRVLTIDAQNPATLYMGTVGNGVTRRAGVFKSTDGGISWRAANSGLTAIPISSLAVDPQNPSTLYAQTGGGLLKTTDRGATWNAADSGLEYVSLLTAFDPENSNTVFAEASVRNASGVYVHGVYKSTDGAASWSPSWIAPAPDSHSGWLAALAVDPRNSNIVYAITADNDDCGDVCGYETLRKSVDGGITWSEFSFKDLGISLICISALAIDPQNPANLYMAGYGGVFKSTDAGVSWSPANSGFPTGSGGAFRAAALAIDPRKPSTLYAVSLESSWGVFKSTDGGANWSPAISGLPDRWFGTGNCEWWTCYFSRLAVDPTNPDRVYLAASVYGWALVFKSADGGRSWTDSGLSVSGQGGAGGLAVSSQDPSTVYAGTPEGVFAMSNAVP